MLHLLDACSIINLLHIDEDEFLLKKLSGFQFKVCKEVFEESRKNVFKKFERIRPYPSDKHKIIEKKLSYFRERIYNDESYLDLLDDISNLTNYNKKNGELYSITLSFFLNIFEQRRILFITDDSPAKDHFAPFLHHHKIGYIEDSVDLLVFLYRHSEEFTSNDLRKFLSALYVEYVHEIAEIEKKLNEVQIPIALLKNKDITYNLQVLRSSIRNLELSKFEEVYELVNSEYKRFQFLYELLQPYAYFFNKKTTNDYLNKIKEHIAFIESKPFYKFCSN